jgi:tetratricopeptide (TPR) repeat protein/DNA-binding MarR family transcriptional regulator
MAINKSSLSFKLTVQERILLHLNEYTKNIEQLEVPFALTQEGIAEGVGVVRSAIPRAIKKLISKEYVKEHLAHVNGLTRRRKVYFLTTDGIVQAMELKNKLLTLKIKVIDNENQTIDCSIQDVPKKIGEKIPVLHLIMNLDSNNVFNIVKFKQVGRTIEELDKRGDDGGSQHPSLSTPVKQQLTPDIHKISDNNYFIDKAPKISHFIGRKSELVKIHKYLNQDSYKIIIVHGIAGIGKTTLAVKVLEELYDKQSLFWYRFHEWDTVRNMLTAFSKFLELFNKYHLRDYLEASQNIDLNDVAEILESEIQGLNAVFFLDDSHKINEQLLALFTLIREMLERIDGIKFLIFSRSIIPFYDRREVLVKEQIFELELEGLNEVESKELLKKRKVKVDNFTKIYEITKGHPLSLELLDPSMELQKQKNITLYLEEEVLARLSIREKSLLKIASVFRYPVPAEGFFIYEKAQINRETISVLARKAIIKESDDGYEVHDLIRDFFYSYLTPKEKTTFHRKIGEFYLTQLRMINNLLKKKISMGFRPQTITKSMDNINGKKRKILGGFGTGETEPLLELKTRGILEAQYHFLKAKEFNRAAEVAIIMGHDLLNLSYAEEILDNLVKIEAGLVSDEFLMDLKILKADVLDALGNNSEALKLYKESIVIAEKENDKTKLAELYRKLGIIQEKLNEYDNAIELLNKSLTISKMLGDAKSISDAYGGLGDVYWKMSKFEKSNEFYNKCIKSAEEISDLPGKAKTYLSLGIISAKRGQLDESIKYYERCLDILDKGKSLEGFDYSNFYENLSDHYLKTIFSYYIRSNGKND